MTDIIHPSNVCAVCGGPFKGRAAQLVDGYAHASCVGRGGRKRKVRTTPRSKTMATKNLTRAFLDTHASLLGEGDLAATLVRPRTVADCPDYGPCPWVGCKYHLYLDVNPESGSIKINFPDRGPLDLAEPCAMRVAMRGPQTLETVGDLMNLTRERMRQIETRSCLKLKFGGRLEP